MAAAWLLTALAVSGIVTGALLVRSRKSTHYLAAAGGGLLVGIALFWLIPEVGQSTGRFGAFLIAFAIASVLSLADRTLNHTGHAAHPGIILPILIASALHSLLDGWSVRLLDTGALMSVTVVAGLALHKFPEGIALGWVLRRSFASPRRAFVAGTAAELFTVLGAAAEPRLNDFALQSFGTWWPVAVISLIAGGFIFLGLHAVLPAFKERRTIPVFLCTLAGVAALTVFKG